MGRPIAIFFGFLPDNEFIIVQSLWAEAPNLLL